MERAVLPLNDAIESNLADWMVAEWVIAECMVDYIPL